MEETIKKEPHPLGRGIKAIIWVILIVVVVGLIYFFYARLQCGKVASKQSACCVNDANYQEKLQAARDTSYTTCIRKYGF